MTSRAALRIAVSCVSAVRLTRHSSENSLLSGEVLMVPVIAFQQLLAETKCFQINSKNFMVVIPAKAGIHLDLVAKVQWIPAFAGMTASWFFYCKSTFDTIMNKLKSTDSPYANVICTDLGAAMDFYTGQLDFRLDMIMPADAPRIAELSGYGITLCLECRENPHADSAPLTEASGDMVVQRAQGEGAWGDGRAGMQYRDLVPGRLGGHFIASHIRIPDGGPVPDYVHYHRVGFQMIFCRRGWVKVVYEDQGPPFVMHAGDCVLQPPTIRHRVLEASPGLEVIEVGSPAEHETWRDHELVLPTAALHPQRNFGGQCFVRHVAADARWQRARDPRFEFRDTGIRKATRDGADVRIMRVAADQATAVPEVSSWVHAADVHFVFVLHGCLRLRSQKGQAHTLDVDDACVVPAGMAFVFEPSGPCQWLQVALPADATARSARL